MQNYLIKMHEGGCSAAPPAGDGEADEGHGEVSDKPAA